MAHDPARPSAMPITPPISESVIASTRNWARMLRLQAPTAIRKPISRVRSVTDTSMMFMMPIPPTNRETEAIAARSEEHTSELQSRLHLVCRLLLEKKKYIEKETVL